MCKTVEMPVPEPSIDERIAKLRDPSVEDRFKRIENSLDRNRDKAGTLGDLCKAVAKDGEALDSGSYWGMAALLYDICSELGDAWEEVGTLQIQIAKKAPSEPQPETEPEEEA